MSRSSTHHPLCTLFLAFAAACSAGTGSSVGGGARGNHPPIAAAGDDRTVLESDVVRLDATSSSDPDGDPLRFRWELVQRPAGSAAALDDPESATPSFLCDLAGDYVASLVVDDRIVASAPDRIDVHASQDTALRVGPGRALRVPSEAAAVVRDGDVVRIDAGEYRGDVAVWTRNDLRLVASGGEVLLVAAGNSAQDKAIWVIQGSRTTVEGIAFEGCRVRDGNGAGIRLEGGYFVARGCRFIRNQTGFLCGDLTQSRAAQTRIFWSRLVDSSAGTSSYVVDVPDGGIAILVGNVIQKGVASSNETVISFAEESHGVHPIDELYVAHNTVVNDRHTATFVRAVAGTAQLVNNVFCGTGTVLSGAGTQLDNLVSSSPGFVDRAAFDYRLVPGSPAIDAGLPPGSAYGVALAPAFEYLDVARSVPRIDPGAADLGAFAFAAAR
ncbi:MAG: hypothetical protein HZB39_10305 [Planctomycetes bacterium]|nr:hypothetical protein [Planctomycetota bacterium]